MRRESRCVSVEPAIALVTMCVVIRTNAVAVEVLDTTPWKRMSAIELDGDDAEAPPHLLSLPSDLLGRILELLGAASLARLASLAKDLRDAINLIAAPLLNLHVQQCRDRAQRSRVCVARQPRPPFVGMLATNGLRLIGGMCCARTPNGAGELSYRQSARCTSTAFVANTALHALARAWLPLCAMVLSSSLAAASPTLASNPAMIQRGAVSNAAGQRRSSRLSNRISRRSLLPPCPFTWVVTLERSAALPSLCQTA